MSQLHRELDELRGFVKSALDAVEKQIDAIDQAASKAEGFCSLETQKPTSPQIEKDNANPPKPSSDPAGTKRESGSHEGDSQIPAISITLYNTPGVKKGTVHFTNQNAKVSSCLKGKASGRQKYCSGLSFS